MKYRRRIRDVEAVFYDGTNCIEIIEFLGKDFDYMDDAPNERPNICTIDCDVLWPDHWIVRTTAHEWSYEVHEDEEFTNIYEPAE